jgi:hypothetical protein
MLLGGWHRSDYHQIIKRTVLSACRQRAEFGETSWQVSEGPIVLQKSFCITEHKFFGTWVRRSQNCVGDYIIMS